jgi:ketosteroid isomerase-like protein
MQSQYLLALPLLAALLTDPAQAQSPDSAAVAGTVSAFHQALAAGDSAAALALLAPDVTILESGGRESLAEYRSHHLPGDIQFAQAVPSIRGQLSVTVAGDVAWAVGTSVTTGTIEGRTINSTGAELMVLTRSSGTWRIRAIHWSSRRR